MSQAPSAGKHNCDVLFISLAPSASCNLQARENCATRVCQDMTSFAFASDPIISFDSQTKTENIGF